MSEELESPSFKRESTLDITKEMAPFAPEEQLGEYKLKRWSWYEKQGVVARSSEIVDPERGIVRMKIQDYYAEMLFVITRAYPKGLEESWSIAYIKTELDPDVGDLLRDEGRDLNGLTDKEKKLFLLPLEPEKDTLT